MCRGKRKGEGDQVKNGRGRNFLERNERGGKESYKTADGRDGKDGRIEDLGWRMEGVFLCMLLGWAGFEYMAKKKRVRREERC